MALVSTLVWSRFFKIFSILAILIGLGHVIQSFISSLQYIWEYLIFGCFEIAVGTFGFIASTVHTSKIVRQFHYTVVIITIVSIFIEIIAGFINYFAGIDCVNTQDVDEHFDPCTTFRQLVWGMLISIFMITIFFCGCCIFTSKQYWKQLEQEQEKENPPLVVYQQGINGYVAVPYQYNKMNVIESETINYTNYTTTKAPSIQTQPVHPNILATPINQSSFPYSVNNLPPFNPEIYNHNNTTSVKPPSYETFLQQQQKSASQNK